MEDEDMENMEDSVLKQLAQLVESLGPDAALTQDEARLDIGRMERKGVPEVVYAPGKDVELVLRISHELLDRLGRVLVSRPDESVRLRLIEEFAATHDITGRWSIAISDPSRPVEKTGGRVALITAGSSDLRYAEDAVLLAQQMGCETEVISDVGVAGLHRLFPPLRELLRKGVDAIVVAAGMDGALPSVVAGLVDVPVIGLPTSTGYGAGGKGVAALLSMLQTCSPGLAVVNIDNGVGAGATAALIANRAARARSERGNSNAV